MKIAITGASGFVGRALAPRLISYGADVLVIGRDPLRLGEMLPGIQVCGYTELDKAANGFDMLVHLAVINNDSGAKDEEYERINVDFALETLELALKAGIAQFVNISSVHALDPSNISPYARTKRKAATLLNHQRGIAVTTFYLPAVTTSSFAGKLAFLNRVPPAFRQIAFVVLTSLRPTVHIDCLAEAIIRLGRSEEKPPEVLSDTQLRNPVYRIAKRTIDLTFSLAAIVLFWWLMAAVYIAVRLESPGPGLFRQSRVGKDGHEFTCYKFRSMAEGTPNVATHKVAPQAVTRIGGWLRRTKLDELPQIWNILRNEMSLIGPRPCLPTQIELVEWRRKYDVFSLKPGISGYAQVNGVDMSNPEKLAKWDARYLALQSLLLDLKIGLATILGRGNGDRVR